MLRGIPSRFVGRPLALALVLAASCSLSKMGPLSDLDAAAVSSPWPMASAMPPAPPPDPGARPPEIATAPPGSQGLPPRPVPKSSPTVTVTMPVEVQLRAIQYMAAMQAPRASDAPADMAYAQSIAAQLRAAGKTDVLSGGRGIDIETDKNCNASLPREAIAHHTAASSLETLLAHGILVVRCRDRGIQCLQSTRESDDVLCTRK